MIKHLVFLILITALSATASAGDWIEKTISYKAKDTQFEGYLVYKKGNEKKPGILVVHDWLGLTDKTKSQSKRLAELGYVVFAADIYGAGIRPEYSKAGETAGIYKNNRTLFRERLIAGLTAFQSQNVADNKKIAAVGYCFGGTGVLELARSGADVKAVISFHGGLDSPTPSDGKKIKSKVLALHGADDPFVKAEDLTAFEREMIDNKIDWQLIKYGGAVHSFTDKSAGNDNSKGAAYNAKADIRSWEAMRQLLSESF